MVELRFAEKVSKEIIDKTASKLKKNYVYQEPLTEHSFMFEVGKATHQTIVEFEGHKLSSLDRTEIILVKTNAFSSSQLAPYVGWDHFVARAKREWASVRAAIGPKKLSRVGVRFINRIDVPGALKIEIDPSDYVSASPSLPRLNWKPLKRYLMQVARPEESARAGITINTGTIQSPLVGYLSILLDIDVFRESDIPGDEESLWMMIENFRNDKNEIFESSITDASRALFNQ